MRLLLSVVLIVLVVVSAETVGSRRIYTPRRSERGSFGDLFEFVYDSSASHDSSETSETSANDARQFFPFTGLDIGSLSGQANQGVKGLFNIPLVGRFIKPLQQGTEDSGAKVDETNQHSLIGFSNGLDPWWMGPNVCTRKEERTERGKIEKLNATEVGGDSKENRWRLRNVINRKMTSCVDLGEVYKCTEKVTHADETKTETIIHECCQGFERADLSGCTKEIELHDLKTTLENLNLTRFLEVTDRNGLNDLITEGNNYTYFVPNNAAWDNVIESVSRTKALKQ
uniref:FAS1 domain-containing protein n=1 Tax=Plectus sambesii TaxID=2011161 RepID=A0A914UIP2_9BILA